LARCQNRFACHPATGLSLLNISLDTLRPERFEAMTRRRGLHRVLDTLQQAVGLGYDPVKVSVCAPSVAATSRCHVHQQLTG
jgi:molybdenum cofactor biosynthesis enzyme MoaA